MTKRRVVFLLLVPIILAQTACADVITSALSRKFSEWAGPWLVDQFGFLPVIIVLVVGLVVVIVWGIIVRKRRSQNKE